MVRTFLSSPHPCGSAPYRAWCSTRTNTEGLRGVMEFPLQVNAKGFGEWLWVLTANILAQPRHLEDVYCIADRCVPLCSRCASLPQKNKYGCYDEVDAFTLVKDKHWEKDRSKKDKRKHRSRRREGSSPPEESTKLRGRHGRSDRALDASRTQRWGLRTSRT